MICAVCNRPVETGKAYCADCQIRTDDRLMGCGVKFRRFCGGCGGNTCFESINAMVIRCTVCGLSHEVGLLRAK